MTDMGVTSTEYGDEDRRGSFQKDYIYEGMNMIFLYDEGSPTRLFMTIDSICPIPEGTSLESYPRMLGTESAVDVACKRRRIDEQPLLTASRMDDAMPSLAHRLLREHGIHLEIGKGLAMDDRWAVIWGGSPKPAYQSSLECVAPFDDMDECLYCFDEVNCALATRSV
jgi:hypothetical protein